MATPKYDLPLVDPDLLDKALLQAAQWLYPGRKVTIIRHDRDPNQTPTDGREPGDGD